MGYSVVGKSVQRVDALAKVTGKAKYTDDFLVKGMLIGKILRSPYAHAMIKRIDVSQAKALPGVEAVITYQDVPQNKFATAGHLYSLDPNHRDEEDRFILTNKARFVGDAVAAVVATDELIAEEALKCIKVEYEELEVLLTPEAAMSEGAPRIHEDSERNILSSRGYEMGDIDAAFREADKIFDGEYETTSVQHCHLENQTSYSYIDGEGRIVLVTSTQIPPYRSANCCPSSWYFVGQGTSH